MELNASFLKKLEDKSKLIDDEKLTAEEKITLLCKYGDAGKNVGMKINGVMCYSFLSEETLYHNVFGMSKADYEITKDPEYMNKHKFKHEKFVRSISYSKHWKPELKKHYRSQDFEIIEKIINDALNSDDYQKLNLITNSAYHVYNMLPMLKASTPLYYATNYYLSVGQSAEERLNNDLFIYMLIKSKEAENFSRVLFDDVKSVYGVEDENVIFEILNQRVENVEEYCKTLTADQFGDN